MTHPAATDPIRRLQVRIRQSLYDALQAEADDEMVSVAVVVRRVLRAHVESRLGRDGGAA